ncbi:MAG: zinc ribbon domain-containing protein [Candidatus Bathyarchaeota archaeon]|nr:zinc ribbon domain-containing protein [Candidatus Bathyarchaeota archaeon]
MRSKKILMVALCILALPVALCGNVEGASTGIYIRNVKVINPDVEISGIVPLDAITIYTPITGFAIAIFLKEGAGESFASQSISIRFPPKPLVIRKDSARAPREDPYYLVRPYRVAWVPSERAVKAWFDVDIDDSVRPDLPLTIQATVTMGIDDYAWTVTIRESEAPTRSEPPPPTGELVVSIETDATSYEQGEAVNVTGEVLYNTKPTPPADNLVAIKVKVPGSELQRLFSVKTDNSGRFGPVLPFTGHKIGKYTLIAECSLKTESGEKVLAKSEYSFEVKKAIIDEDAIPNQLRKLTELFKKSIPEGPVRTSGLGKTLGVPESLYGSIHNVFLYKTKTDPTGDFACRGYQEQTLVFMDSIRFNKDPEVRKLLKGLDYGPVCRGMVIINAHHSVVVYPIGTDWKSNEGPPVLWPKVFDPWPEQRPKVYTVAEFCGGAGFPRIDDGYYYVDEAKPWSCYPLTGGEVYANFEVVKAARPQYLRPNTETLLRTKFSAAIRCPVDVLLTDSQGKRLGMLPNGSFVWEFPAFIYRASEGNRTLGWYFELPDGIYNTTITGQSTGTFDLLIKDDAEAGRYFDYGNQSITTDAQAKITIGMERTESLTLPGGEKVTPKEIPIPTVETPPSPTPTYEYAVLAAVIMFVVVAVYLRKRSKSQLAKLVQAPLQPQPPQYMRQPPHVSPPVVAARPPLQTQKPVEEKIACPSCGAQNLPASTFCGKCGGTLQQTYAFCEECGRRIPEGATYCKYCGDKQGE